MLSIYEQLNFRAAKAPSKFTGRPCDPQSKRQRILAYLAGRQTPAHTAEIADAVGEAIRNRTSCTLSELSREGLVKRLDKVLVDGKYLSTWTLNDGEDDE